MREIEVKLRANNFQNIENILKQRDCILSEPIQQHDVIYSKKSISNEFEKTKEGDAIIRIRNMNNVSELNLKQQKSGEMDNLEYETEIKDPEVIHKMLEILGWYPVVEVKKIRRKGKLGKYEICLDEVEKLGTFIELEKLTEDDADPDQVRNELFEELKNFGLSRDDEETRGYDTQIYELEIQK